MTSGDPRLDEVLDACASGDFPRAHAACLRLSRARPADPRVASTLAMILLNLGKVEEAVAPARKAAALAPNDPQARINLARVLALTADVAGALAALGEARRLAPADPEPRRVESLIHAEHMRFVECINACDAGLALAPGDRDLAATRAMALLNTARPEDAYHALGDLARARADDDYVLSCRALVSNYVPGLPAREIFDVHRAWAALLEHATPLSPRGPRTSVPAGRLRVALLTPDLRRHSVAYFALPLLAALDRARCEVWVYYTNRHADGLTVRARALADRWIDCANIADATLAERIRFDAPDVLLELSGHTSGHSLACVHRRPAPLVATYLGYPNTTGLRAVDLRLTDSHADPADSLATERLVRLDPCFLAFEPPAEAPDPAPRPAGTPPTFGSFNAVSKLNEYTIGLWTRVLDAAPGSRLVLKAMHLRDDSLRRDIAARFAARGADPARVLVLPPAPTTAAHLASYGAIDVALDPFPYHGTTTTLEALWMGVPVVSLPGETHASRVGVSILTNAGLPDLIARDADDYVRLATALTADAARRAALRTELRGRLRASPLLDARGLATRLLDALGAPLGTTGVDPGR
ncbi:MAG: glycosyltransferase [Planctomycetota bacterium]|nr:glycosyltransferase [Planctomycetota bacterium]